MPPRKEKKALQAEAAARERMLKATRDACANTADVLAPFAAMRMFDRGGLRAELLAIHAADLTSYQFEFCFALLKANMEDLYNQTRFQGKGWRDGDKRRELVHADARFLLAVEPETKEPMGFLEYRVLIEDDEVVFYVWEIQLVPRVCKHGLGRYMMQMAELVARKHGLDKLMLTVFKENVAAMQFYKQKLRYTVDETDPSVSHEAANYEILSKKLVKPKPILPDAADEASAAVASKASVAEPAAAAAAAAAAAVASNEDAEWVHVEKQHA